MKYDIRWSVTVQFTKEAPIEVLADFLANFPTARQIPKSPKHPPGEMESELEELVRMRIFDFPATLSEAEADSLSHALYQRYPLYLEHNYPRPSKRV